MKIRKINKYEIVDVIGQGSMGVVYKCIDTVLNRYVALKTLNLQLADNPTIKERFFREAKILANLNHKNIVQVYELKEFQNFCYIVMEYLEGESLKEIIENKKPLSGLSKLEIVRQIASGIAYAHSKGVIHRDLKPANIFLRDDGVVKILDFGVAKLKSSAITKRGTILGTISYMAPEQLKGLDIDERADIFSIGAIMYEMFAYKKPFHAKTITEIMDKIINSNPDNIPRATGDINAVIFKCLAKNPEERYEKAEDLIIAIEEIIAKQKQKKQKTKSFMDHTITSQILNVKEQIQKLQQMRKTIKKHIENAKFFLKKDQLNEAIKEAEKVLKLDNANQEAEEIIEKAKKYLKLKEEQEKLKVKWIKDKLEEAYREKDNGNLIKACEICESILKIDPFNHDAKVIKSICVKKIKEFLERIEKDSNI